MRMERSSLAALEPIIASHFPPYCGLLSKAYSVRDLQCTEVQFARAAKLYLVKNVTGGKCFLQISLKACPTSSYLQSYPWL